MLHHSVLRLQFKIMKYDKIELRERNEGGEIKKDRDRERGEGREKERVEQRICIHIYI